MQLIDTHAHLDQDDFDADRPKVVQRAQAAGLVAVVTVGTTAESSQAAVALSRDHVLLFAAVGIQPNYCAAAKPEDWDAIVRLASEPRVVAIGETGVDRHWDYTPFKVQQDYFDRHLRLSQSLDRPVIIHTRESDADVVAMLREARVRGPLRGVMHSFTGTVDTALECIELGMHISFAGMVTFKKSDELRAVAAAVPLDRLLVETDSPYLSPHPLRGKRNEPANVIHTANCIAAARGMQPEEFASHVTVNARAIFGLPSA